ncbi:hypothetical protein [Bacillus marasmi]|uniref:hypothetical protein n=1 Tax=Bacillus marasmi TaxID=1926279 RepID=UPI0011CC6FF7|nr:hypothetical protein [Bacillus marasmi]
MKTIVKLRSNNALEQYKQQMKVFKEKITPHFQTLQTQLSTQQKTAIFLSIGSREMRAVVFSGTGNQLETSWKNASDKAGKYIKKHNYKPDWIKADIITQQEEISIVDFITKITKTRSNYFRYGFSLDSDFNLAFIEQEVNANAFIKFDKEHNRAYLSEDNMNYYCNHYRNLKGKINFNAVKGIVLFTTTSYFFDGEFLELEASLLSNGRRKAPSLDREDVLDIVRKSSQFLANQVQNNGKYIYGYFPCFNKKINFYNILRHASSTYALNEAYEMSQSPELIQPIRKALEYLELEAIAKYNQDGKILAYVQEKSSDSEIKLGANAAAILAYSKYTKVFKDEKYLPLMRQLAAGIEKMQNPETGQFIHILNPDLSVKEAFRIIYYDGEAAFALMRLYELDRNPKWLEIVEKAFNYFIENNYWKHHDHWLSYCTNELTQYKPLDKYFRFGLDNVKDKLTFMMERETTYPTFLELTTAAYKMINRIKELNKHELLSDFDEERLLAVIHHRAHYQLNGFFFPEVAMYFANPGKILNGFFIRHHSFRCRIDDVEHNISGYCSYVKDVLKS